MGRSASWGLGLLYVPLYHVVAERKPPVERHGPRIGVRDGDFADRPLRQGRLGALQDWADHFKA